MIPHPTKGELERRSAAALGILDQLINEFVERRRIGGHIGESVVDGTVLQLEHFLSKSVTAQHARLRRVHVEPEFTQDALELHLDSP